MNRRDMIVLVADRVMLGVLAQLLRRPESLAYTK